MATKTIPIDMVKLAAGGGAASLPPAPESESKAKRSKKAAEKPQTKSVSKTKTKETVSEPPAPKAEEKEAVVAPVTDAATPEKKKPGRKKKPDGSIYSKKLITMPPELWDNIDNIVHKLQQEGEDVTVSGFIRDAVKSYIKRNHY